MATAAAAPVTATGIPAAAPTVPDVKDTAAVPSAFTPAPVGAKTNTTHVSIDGNRVKTTAASEPIVPPDMQWKEPVQVVQAKPEAQGGNRAIVTFGETMTATKVKDGDGVDLKNKDGKKVVCRIDGINAPEVAHLEDWAKDKIPHQNFGERSKKILADMIENKEVTVRITEPAEGRKDNRNICQIEIEGKDVSTEMLRKGAAWLYREYVKNPDRLKQLTEAAQPAIDKRLGLYEDDPAPIDPYTFRKMAKAGLVK